MKILLDDPKLFGNDAGEDEDESVLVSYFVDRAEFARFLDPNVRLQVAKGRKGTGKSALLVRFAHDRRGEAGPHKPVVLQRIPSSLTDLKPPPDTENSVILENYWKQVICGAINMELADEIGFAWKDNQIALVESAELAGFKGRNLVSALMSRLVSKINLGAVELVPSPKAAPNHEQLLLRVMSEEELRRPVWFLLDDIDTKYQNTAAQQAFISSFFSACRYLVREMQGVGIRATVRTDVWASLKGAEDLDKFDQYITDITWSARQQESILINRILAYIKRNYPGNEAARSWTVKDNAEPLLASVFVPRWRWDNANVPAEHVLRILAGSRPRWLTQLCRMAGERAAAEKKDRVQLHHATQSMREFGQRRLADLYREHQYQFSELKALIESFSGGVRSYATDKLLQHLRNTYLKKKSGHPVPMVDGVAYRHDRQLARLLFMIGFVNGHHFQRSGNTPEFVSFEERPDLLEVPTNLDDGMSWEVQPAYRNVLNIRDPAH
jgi:hypothetical protein